jgi:hypothetical protein
MGYIKGVKKGTFLVNSILEKMKEDARCLVPKLS